MALLGGVVGGRAATGVGPFALAWGTATGISRVLLGVHWPSDVLGALLFAGLWIELCSWIDSASRNRVTWGSAGADAGRGGLTFADGSTERTRS